MKLIRLLKRAHAIETGAIEAYEGHAASVKDPTIRAKIKEIQKEEWFHRQAVGFMLDELNSGPNHFLDGVFWLIGKTISMACHVMGYRAAMWGAHIMEKLGTDVYSNLAFEARKSDRLDMASNLDRMQFQEYQHALFFRWFL